MKAKLWIFLGFFCGGIWVLTHTTQLYWAQTPSLPEKVFFMVKGLKAQKGDLVTVSGHKTLYFPENLIYTKRLVGLSGDRIRQKGAWIEINGTLIGKLRSQTEKGRPLTPLKSQIIPQGYVFVMADHPNSFDSRYEEFGLIKNENLLGKTWGLF